MNAPKLIPVFAIWAVLAMTSGHAQSDNSSPTKVEGKPTKTTSGLEYWDIKAGTGDPAVAGKQVTVHYTGWRPTARSSTAPWIVASHSCFRWEPDG